MQNLEQIITKLEELGYRIQAADQFNTSTESSSTLTSYEEPYYIPYGEQGELYPMALEQLQQFVQLAALTPTAEQLDFEGYSYRWIWQECLKSLDPISAYALLETIRWSVFQFFWDQAWLKQHGYQDLLEAVRQVGHASIKQTIEIGDKVVPPLTAYRLAKLSNRCEGWWFPSEEGFVRVEPILWNT
jgi:hypothetical protein